MELKTFLVKKKHIEDKQEGAEHRVLRVFVDYWSGVGCTVIYDVSESIEELGCEPGKS